MLSLQAALMSAGDCFVWIGGDGGDGKFIHHGDGALGRGERWKLATNITAATESNDASAAKVNLRTFTFMRRSLR
jgi:hypothetical protein